MDATSTAAGCPCRRETRSCRGAAASPATFLPGLLLGRVASVVGLLVAVHLEKLGIEHRDARSRAMRWSCGATPADRWTLLVIESCGRRGLVCWRSGALGGAAEPLRQRLRVGREFGIPDDLAVA